MKGLSLLAPFAVMFVFLSGCAGQKPTNTGFLTNQQATDLQPAQRQASYSVYIQEVAFVNNPAAPRRVNNAAITDLKNTYRRALESQFAKYFEIVKVPRGDSLRVRAAVTDYQPAYPLVNIPITILGGVPLTYGGVTTEAEVLLPEGETLAAQGRSLNGTLINGRVYDAFTLYGYSRSGTRDNAKHLARETARILGRPRAKSARARSGADE
jgi:hypothetical protein